MYLVISDHAYDRLAQRVQGEVEIPEERILRLGQLVDTNEEFHVNEFLYTFVCKRTGDSCVLVTVLLNVTYNAKMTKQNRIQEFRNRRLGRQKTNWTELKKWVED
jgi:hypothetical protein